METKNEDLFLQSLDGSVTPEQKEMLTHELAGDFHLRKSADQFLRIREKLKRSEPDSFGPFFAERIINKIKNLKQEVDYQIFFFFKKYQVAVIGVVVALLVLNIIFSDNLSIRSVLGFEDQPKEDTVAINLYQDLIN
ncbi:MAG: hypothetical protein OJF59_002614 [Cytophagales bacterium]|jgi:hypothetical protein|nr:hypothetical protein [Bacteroidota bacterium]MBS1980332.1 hypothetical protein [Bacteroidota bacterium]WHZ08860.1 MAG: hypothetical protein OJF59_002614 [Cytophagales bacterium]